MSDVRKCKCVSVCVCMWIHLTTILCTRFRIAKTLLNTRIHNFTNLLNVPFAHIFRVCTFTVILPHFFHAGRVHNLPTWLTHSTLHPVIFQQAVTCDAYVTLLDIQIWKELIYLEVTRYCYALSYNGIKMKDLNTWEEREGYEATAT